VTSHDHPLDVDLEVLAAAPWLPWTPTTCPTCHGSGHRYVAAPLSDGNRFPCPHCSAGLVVPQVGDVINWTVREALDSDGDWFRVTSDDVWENSDHDKRRSRTVARSTVHQTAPILQFMSEGPGHEPERLWEPWNDGNLPALPFVRLVHDRSQLWLHPRSVGRVLDTVDLTVLLAGPWAELWVPGNVALEITTEVER
jgi:hypothetical protein